MHFFYNCREAHQKLSEALDHELGLAERAQLKIHLSMCRSCNNFRLQMRTLHNAMQRLDRWDETDKSE